MSAIADRFTRLATDFREKADSVPAERWEAPSPCEGWTARDVVKHLVESHQMQLGFLDIQLDDVPAVDTDPVAALRIVNESVAQELATDERASRMIRGLAGEMRFDESIDTFLSFDLLIHTWDIAQATGLDPSLNLDDVQWAWKIAEGFGGMIRAEGVCGPALTPPVEADEQTKLLAYLGRQAW